MFGGVVEDVEDDAEAAATCAGPWTKWLAGVS